MKCIVSIEQHADPKRVISPRLILLISIVNQRDKNLTRSGSATEFKKIENQDLYVDGAVFSKRKQVGIGVIIRDSASMVIAAPALSRKLALPLGALEIEAKAIEVGVQFAMDVGVRDVMLEGVSMCICNALQEMGEASSSVQNYCFFPYKKTGKYPCPLFGST